MRRTRKPTRGRAERGRGFPGPQLTAFPPLLGANPRLLILGSLPGVASLALGQYYAHPRNLFWDLMGEIVGFDRDLPYPDRVARLTASGIAVWDVLHRARRPGSLDSDIAQDGLEANDFASFYRAHATLRAVAFNGRSVHALYRRHVLPELTRADMHRHPPSRSLVLPSTSPAHAGRTRAEKLALWRAIDEFLTLARPADAR